MLEGRTQLGIAYPLLKMASTVGSYLPGAPGGLFAPSLAIGAGMVGYLAAITQSRITAFVIETCALFARAWACHGRARTPLRLGLLQDCKPSDGLPGRRS
ncbi:H+/Cl- antiporter ClcA [Paraburkholderia sp. 40]